MRSAETPVRLDSICLRVRDLAESAAFYEQVLGLRGAGPTTGARTWRGEAPRPGAHEPPGLRVELVEGLPDRARMPLDHFSVRVATPEAVDGIHRRAAERHARTSQPRRAGRRWRCCVYDPDGHKVEVFAPLSPEQPPRAEDAVPPVHEPLTPETDRALAEAVHGALLRDERLSELTIDVTAREGVVTLEGHVPDHRRKLAAHEVARARPGCVAVVNRLRVEPVGLSDDAEIAARVRAALRGHEETTKATISVDVASGVVTLRGTAGSSPERLRAEDVALAVPGARRVENLLMVDEAAREQDVRIERRIRDELARTPELGAEAVNVAVAGRGAVLSGRVRHAWQRKAVEAHVRAAGLLHVRNEIRRADRSRGGRS